MRVIGVIVCQLISLACLSQKSTAKPVFDIVGFNKKAALAEWLYDYALFAHHANTELNKQNLQQIRKVGAASFCYQQDNLWHSVYGNYQNGVYSTVFHFVMTPGKTLMKTSAEIDSNFLKKHALALSTATAQIPSMDPKREVRFEQFIKQNNDKTFTVCFFPAFQSDEVAIYGEEFVYTIDSTGTRLLKDESYYKGKFKAHKVDKPRPLLLDYEDADAPTVGAIYFVWFYKDFFSKMTIDNAKSMSLLAKTNLGWKWQHAIKID